MKSTKISVEGSIYVWAWPKNPDYDDMEGGMWHFELQHSGSYHWRTGAICIYEQKAVVHVPEGIDLLAKAVETVEAKMAQAKVDYDVKIVELQRELNGLLQLTHQSDAIEGELV